MDATFICNNFLLSEHILLCLSSVIILHNRTLKLNYVGFTPPTCSKIYKFKSTSVKHIVQGFLGGTD